MLATTSVCLSDWQRKMTSIFSFRFTKLVSNILETFFLLPLFPSLPFSSSSFSSNSLLFLILEHRKETKQSLKNWSSLSALLVMLHSSLYKLLVHTPVLPGTWALNYSWCPLTGDRNSPNGIAHASKGHVFTYQPVRHLFP